MGFGQDPSGNSMRLAVQALLFHSIVTFGDNCPSHSPILKTSIGGGKKLNVYNIPPGTVDSSRVDLIQNQPLQWPVGAWFHFFHKN
jgi:hypothetical protein